MVDPVCQPKRSKTKGLKVENRDCSSETSRSEIICCGKCSHRKPYLLTCHYLIFLALIDL